MNSERKQTIRVLVVDDHKSFVWGISKLIEGERPRMELVGSAVDRESALALARAERPDIILLDLDLRGENSLDFLPVLLADDGARVIVLTGKEDVLEHERAISLGASGVVMKTEEPEVILRAIEKVHGGELWLDRLSTGRVFAKLARGGGQRETDLEAVKIDSLTPTERAVICALSEMPGTALKEIAARLNISPNTLTNHLTSIYSKLGIEPPNSRFKLFMYAKAHNLDHKPA